LFGDIALFTFFKPSAILTSIFTLPVLLIIVPHHTPVMQWLAGLALIIHIVCSLLF
jgi:hypothetical protein